jgi:hypothetical protein
MPEEVQLWQISPETRALYRAQMDRDPWIFSDFVCKHVAKSVPRIHRPLLYLYTRQADLLCALLDDPDYEGEITRQVREDFERKGIDWRDPAHLPLVKRRLRKQNTRLPRGIGKSTFADDGDLWEAVKDPNTTIFLGSKSDDYAELRVIAMGDVVKSPEFAFWYPERVPKDLKSDVTQGAIKLAGRTIANVEATIEGHGITSQVTGRHFRKVRGDDIVGTESGQASEDDAVGFIANIDGISVRERFGGTDRLLIGTVTGENDDHSMLAANDEYLSVVMPIERHSGGTTLENINDDGELTMPEMGWFDRDSVNKIKAEAKANPKHGLMWLMQNFYMIAHKSGVTTFTQPTMNAAKFLWYTDPETRIRYILRPKKGKQGTPRRTVKVRGKERIVPVIPEDWFVLDPRKLPRSAFAWAMDQAVSVSGDPWSMTLVCMDWDGIIYILANVSDVGYKAQIDNILPFDQLAQRDFGCPGKPGSVGLDANGQQAMTTEWLTRDADFRDIARRAKEIRSGGEGKEMHIRRWLQGRFMSGDSYFNPNLIEFEKEALSWRPRKPDGGVNKKAIDNNLDSAWMASTLPHRPPSPYEMDEDSLGAMFEANRHRQHTDPATGIITDDWTRQMWRDVA